MAQVRGAQQVVACSAEELQEANTEFEEANSELESENIRLESQRLPGAITLSLSLKKVAQASEPCTHS